MIHRIREAWANETWHNRMTASNYM